jgi:hypothetical protein
MRHIVTTEHVSQSKDKLAINLLAMPSRSRVLLNCLIHRLAGYLVWEEEKMAT